MSADASREAFEAWAMSKAGGHQSCTKAGAHDIERTYWSFSTDEQWVAWQASRKQALAESEQVCAGVCTPHLNSFGDGYNQGAIDCEKSIKEMK